MKTFMFFLFLFGFALNHVNATGEELSINFKNKPSGNYKIRIEPVLGTTLYDGNFNPVPRSDPAYSEVEENYIHFNAVYVDAGNFAPDHNGYVYYGKYDVSFKHYDFEGNLLEIMDGATIDFRDGDYGYPTGVLDVYTGVSNPQDFYIYYEFNTTIDTLTGDTLLPKPDAEAGRVYFKYGEQEYTGNSYGIWDLKGKAQNTSRFKNFKLRLEDNGTYLNDPTQVTIGSSSYSLQSNGELNLGLGFNSENRTVIVDGRTLKGDILPWALGLFSYWIDRSSGAPLHLFDSSISVTSGELALNIKARYKYFGYHKYNTVTGPESFDHKMNLTFTSNHQSVSGGYYYYDWWIKYDFNNTWQNLGGGLKTKSIMTSDETGYSF